MEGLLSLVIAALFGYWCYNISDKQGRNSTLGAIMGFLFGIFAVIVYYIMGDKKCTCGDNCTCGKKE